MIHLFIYSLIQFYTEEEEIDEELTIVGIGKDGLYIPPYGPVIRSRSSMRARGLESDDDVQISESQASFCPGCASGPGSDPGSLSMTAAEAGSIEIIMDENYKKNLARSRSNSIEKREEDLRRENDISNGKNKENNEVSETRKKEDNSVQSSNIKISRRKGAGDWSKGYVGVASKSSDDADKGHGDADDDKGVITVRRLNSHVASIVRTAGTEMKKKIQIEKKEKEEKEKRERARRYLNNENEVSDGISSSKIRDEIKEDHTQHDSTGKESISYKKGSGRERALSGAVSTSDDVYQIPSPFNLSDHVVLIAGVGANPLNWAPANSLILPIIYFIKAVRAHSGDKIVVLCERAQELIPLIGEVH